MRGRDSKADRECVGCDEHRCDAHALASHGETVGRFEARLRRHGWTDDGVSWWCPEHTGWGPGTAPVSGAVLVQAPLPPFRVHDDGRILLYAPVQRENLERMAPGALFHTLWERYRELHWEQVWPPVAEPGLQRMSDDEANAAGWRPARLVVE